MNYSECLEYLYGLERYGIRAGLEVVEAVLAALGNPQHRFRSVHIAGTNGKGSTAAILASLLKAAGVRVGLYTSPHLIDFTERIRIDGVPIGQEAVAGLVEQVRTRIPAGLCPTFFELTTAMAFTHFARSGVEVAVVEAGMGGRLDATNTLLPLVSVITNVDYDHEAFLGGTLAAIAREKAGIVKAGVPLVTATANPEAIEVLVGTCQRLGSRLIRLGEAFSVAGESPRAFDYTGLQRVLRRLHCPLLGAHQLENAAVALAAAELLADRGLALHEAAVREGLRNATWEGRLEVVRASPLVLLDGAHNPAGARALAKFLGAEKRRRGGKLVLAVGMLADKNLTGFFRELLPLGDYLIVTRPDYTGAATLTALQDAAKDYAVSCQRCPKIAEALEAGMRLLGPPDILCVTGSLYTVGAARAHLQGRPVPTVIRG